MSSESSFLTAQDSESSPFEDSWDGLGASSSDWHLEGVGLSISSNHSSASVDLQDHRLPSGSISSSSDDLGSLTERFSRLTLHAASQREDSPRERLRKPWRDEQIGPARTLQDTTLADLRRSISSSSVDHHEIFVTEGDRVSLEFPRIIYDTSVWLLICSSKACVRCGLTLYDEPGWWSCRRCGDTSLRYCFHCARLALVADQDRDRIIEARHRGCIGCAQDPSLDAVLAFPSGGLAR